MQTQEKTKKSLTDFLLDWDERYLQEIKKIDLFKPQLTQRWPLAQRQYFVKIFYHSRGHFRDFLWFLGNFAPNKRIKSIILENIREEFNDDNLSHEQLYLDYAKKLNVDLTQEILYEDSYLPEMKKFNQAHIIWMMSKDWESQFSAFAAYERLDSTDYTALAQLNNEEHLFFKVHRLAKHFDKTYQELTLLWDSDTAKVKEAFEFIADTQIIMWLDLSKAVFNFRHATS